MKTKLDDNTNNYLHSILDYILDNNYSHSILDYILDYNYLHNILDFKTGVILNCK